MKKSFCLILLCLFSSAVYGAEKVQPFIDCVITSSPGELHHHLNYSPGFPVRESKLFLILRYGNTVKRAEIPLQKTISFEWKDSPGKTAFCSSNIKWEFPRVTNVSIENKLMPSKILFPGRKVVLMTWETTSLADGKTLEQFCGETGLELQVPEHILKKYAGGMSYEDLVMQKFLKKLNVPDYWQFAKKFPAIPPESKCNYQIYPEMIRGNVVELWDKYQRKFAAGQIALLPILELEIRIMEVMLYAENLPEPMRKKLVMEQCRRYKKILSFTETAFSAGWETKESVDIAKSNLKRFMQKHSHLISCADIL